jgi:hypothetical protein
MAFLLTFANISFYLFITTSRWARGPGARETSAKREGPGRSPTRQELLSSAPSISGSQNHIMCASPLSSASLAHRRALSLHALPLREEKPSAL